MSPSVFIIIVNWKNWQDTVECLESLQRNNYGNFRTVVVENHSENESYDKLSEWSKDKERLTILQTEANLGFAGGNNVGIRYALANDAEYLLLLNNDTVVTEDFLSSLIKTTMEEDAGITGCKILHHSDGRIWYLGGKMSWMRGGAYHPGKGRPDRKIAKKPFEVDFVTGCMMLIKREVFGKIGVLDESYFLYNEDTDYCVKAFKAGIKMVVDPLTIIYHKERSTDGGWKPYHIYYLIRNKLIFINRYAPDSVTLWTFYSVIGLVGLTLSVKWVFQNRFDLISAYLKAISDYSKGIFGKINQTELTLYF